MCRAVALLGAMAILGWGVSAVAENVTITFSSRPRAFVTYGGAVFFLAGEIAEPVQIWRSDGTESGTELVTSMHSMSTWSKAAGSLYFAGEDQREGDGGWELWKTDGTVAGTVLVKDIYEGTHNLGFPDPLPNESYPSGFVELNGSVLFQATDGEHGRELWATNGTSIGTRLVADIAPGAASAFIYDPFYPSPPMIAVGGAVLFLPNDGIHGDELWRSDGTEQGTFLVKDINPSADRFQPGATLDEFAVAQDRLFFAGNDGVHGRELWVSDGSEAGTHMVKDINPGPEWALGMYQLSPMAELHSFVFFSATDGVHPYYLWRTDGTEEGTQIVRDSADGQPIGPGWTMTRVGDVLFFFAAHGEKSAIWRTDASDATASLVTDWPPDGGSASTFIVNSLHTPFLGLMLFNNFDDAHGVELWRSDGSAAGTELVADIAPGPASSIQFSGQDSAVLGKLLFFSADDGTHGIEPWVTDGTREGTRMLKNLAPGDRVVTATATHTIAVNTQTRTPASSPTPSRQPTPTRTLQTPPVTLTSTPMPPASVSPTPTPPGCPGDCNFDGSLTSEDVQVAISGLFSTHLLCQTVDFDRDGRIRAHEILGLVEQIASAACNNATAARMAAPAPSGAASPDRADL